MSSTTLLEQFVASLNANVFLAEFAFAGSEFAVAGKGTVEIADHMVLIDELGILFQLKERSLNASSTDADLAKWFASKVRKSAVKQLRETRRMLQEFRGQVAVNQRGHSVPLMTEMLSNYHNVVVYRLPPHTTFVAERGYDSKSAGFVHFIGDVDYLGICEYLVTPTEVADYLSFRHRLLLKYPTTSVSEAALLGQFIAELDAEPPSERLAAVLATIRDEPGRWDMSFVLRGFGDSITYREGDDRPTSHYRILAELAKLSRTELGAFKQRFVLALEAVRADRFELPYRFACPRTDCGFLILPVVREMRSEARLGLRNLSLASKYEMKVRRHASLYIADDSPHVDIQWMFVDQDEPPNPDLDEMLAANYPFRKLKEQVIPRYQLDTQALGDVLADPDG